MIVTVGCGDACPVYSDERYVDWELTDPAGLPVEQVQAIVDGIEQRVRALVGQHDPRNHLIGSSGAATMEPDMTETGDIRETVRRCYAAAATSASALDCDRARGIEVAGCGTAPVSTTDAAGRVVFGAELNNADAAQGAPEAAMAAARLRCADRGHPSRTFAPPVCRCFR